MVPGGNRALENCLQVETKHQTIQGNYSKIRLLMENTHRREIISLPAPSKSKVG